MSVVFGCGGLSQGDKMWHYTVDRVFRIRYYQGCWLTFTQAQGIES